MADYTRWANRDTRRSFSGFLQESGQFLSGDPAEIANQKGWTGDNFGWYRDQNGQVVARSVGGKMVVYDGSAPSSTPMTTDMGNPAITAGQKPAERARTMGLQSNGKGGYMDDSGQVVARTVNGELVFYDDKGGAVSDGAGGQHLTQSSPSWVDPDSGLILVPPAQPETPEEKASTPDPIPATPPMGFDLFITQKHKKSKADAEAQRQAEAEQAQAQQAVEEKYNDEGVMNNIMLLSKGAMERAAASGDETKMNAAGYMMDLLDGYADTMKLYFEHIPETEHKQLSRDVVKEMIFKAKTMAENPESEENFEVIGSLQKPFMASYPEEKLKPTPKLEKGEDRIEGKKVTYILRTGKADSKDIPPVNWGGPEHIINNGSQKAQTEIEVEWEENEGVGGDNKRENRLAALEAVKMWRKDILPKLPEGVILKADPTDEQRRRIYEYAGFGSSEVDGDTGEVSGTMKAWVSTDENGETVLLPMGGVSRNKVQEAYLAIVDQDLNIMEREVVSEMLFG